MAEILETQLGTSDPLDATFGFPIFPLDNSENSPSVPEAVGFGEAIVASHTLFSSTLSLVIWKFAGSLTYSQQYGAFAGFGLSYTVEGETKEDGSATLTITDDDAAGGVGFGCGLSGEFNISLQEYSVKWVSDGWHSGFKGSWENALNFEISIELDLIKLFLQFLDELGIDVPLEKLDETKEALGFATVYGALADASGQFASQGQLTLTPTVNISSNLALAIPALEPLVKAVDKIGGDVSFGPALALKFPITIAPARLKANESSYEFDSFDNGVFSFNKGPTGTTESISNVTVVTSHTVNLELAIVIQGGIGLWSIVDISASISEDLTEGLIHGGFGPFFDSLTNTNGGKLAESAGYTPLPEVVWG